MSKSTLYFLWIGFTLTALFFYPLAASLSDGLYYMQWNVSNTYELIGCLLLGMVIVGTLFYYVTKMSNKYISSSLVIVLSIIPLLSFIVHVSRQMGFTSSLVKFKNIIMANHNITLIIFLLILGVTLFILIRHKDRVIKFIVTFILIISPVSVVITTNIIQHGFKNTLIDIPIEHKKNNSKIKNPPPNIYVILFDELDYEFLYKEKEIKPEFPSFLAFSNTSTNYHNATSPGDSTLPSMTALLLGERDKTVVVCHDRLCEEKSKNKKVPINFSERNIFKKAKSLGYKTAMYGWTHKYCQQYAMYLDSCRTYSLYNYSTVNNNISLLNPILTNVQLWPHQFPFGLLKIPVYSKYQQLMVKETLDHVVNALDYEPPLFMIAHFSLPHIPFVFDAHGFNPPSDPFLQNRENYIKQLAYTDYVFGEIVDKLKNIGKYENSIIVLTSDHGYRNFLKQKDWNKVPLLIHHAKNEKSKNDDVAVMTEKVLFMLLNTENKK
jgi:hypothetical protein